MKPTDYAIGGFVDDRIPRDEIEALLTRATSTVSSAHPSGLKPQTYWALSLSQKSRWPARSHRPLP